MKHKELIHIVVSTLNEFDPNVQGLQEFMHDFLVSQQETHPDDCTFIQEVFSGCMRFEMAINVVVNGFFRSETTRKTCLMSDKNLYRVLVYLSLFRLDELGVAHYRKFVLSQNLNKMHKFLSFFLDETRLKTWIFAEWCKAYDHSYVQINMLSPLIRWLPELQEVLKTLTDKVKNIQQQRDIRSPTAVKPFKLTKVKPRSVPIPEKIPTLQKHQPVPESTYRQPREKLVLKTVKEKNKIKAEKQLIDASMNQFECANAEKSEKAKDRMKKYIKEENEKLKFNMSKLRGLPAHKEDNTPIRLNAAAIMREGLLIQKKEEEELRQLTELATGGRDKTEFLSWQKTMREKDLNEKLADIEAKRLDGKLSYEEAILARQMLIEENKQKVQNIKQETKEMMDAYLKEKFEKEKEMRTLVEQIMEGHENAKEAKVKLKKYKRSIVADVNNESKELMRKALEEAEMEMREKVSLIAKIRAIESVPRIRFKFVDLTETSGAGLLGEMSLAELKERLHLLRIGQKEEEDKRRREILQSKVDKDQNLMDTLESIAKHRSQKGKEAAIRFEEKRSATKREIADPKVAALQERLSARRAEREKYRTQSSPPKLASKQKQLSTQKDTLEELRWRELERSREKATKLHTLTVQRVLSGGKLVNS